MQMPEVFTDRWTVRSGEPLADVGYEHVVGLLLPWRRYNPDVHPTPSEGSPSNIVIGREERHGALLTVSRSSSSPFLDPVELCEMTGELAEAWVALTMARSNPTVD